MYRSKKIFSILEITKELSHGSIHHYGENGEITQSTQVKTHAFVAGQSFADYGEFVVIDEYDNAVRVISRDTLQEEYEPLPSEVKETKH